MRTLDRSHVAAALMQAGYPASATHISDLAYSPPRCDWLTGEFAAWFRSALFALNISTYKAEAWDCDDYADLFAALARMCHRRTSPDSGTALPIGVIHYRASSGPHAVVIALTSDRGLVAIEPQTGGLITVNAVEAFGAWLVKV